MNTVRFYKASIACILASSQLVVAQPATILLEACNSMPDPAKRLGCLKAVIASSGQAASGVSAPAPYLADLEKAFVSLYAAVETGTSYNSYQLALAEVNRFLALYEREALPQKRASIQKMRDALEAYADAGTFWSESIRFYSRSGNDLAFAGGLPVVSLGLAWMVNKYGLPTGKADLLGFNVGVPRGAGLSKMWSIGRARGEEALQGMKLSKSPTDTLLEAAPPPLNPVPTGVLTPDQIRFANGDFVLKAKETIASMLPGSTSKARFRNLHLSTASGGTTILLCGEIDTAGAKTDSNFRRFYYGVEKSLQEIDVELMPTFEAFWHQRCGDKLVDIP